MEQGVPFWTKHVSPESLLGSRLEKPRVDLI
jgi:hypothetical protein